MREFSNIPHSEINSRDIHLDPEKGIELAKDVSLVLEKYQDKRVLVLAPPCSGKSTLLQHIKNGVDMDKVFDTMPADFKKEVLHHERPFMYIDGDRETIKYMEKDYIPGNAESEALLEQTTELLNNYVNENIKIIPGSPVFGANVIDTDVILYLKLSDKVLQSRIKSRNDLTHRMLHPNRVFAIKELLEREIEIRKQNGTIVKELAAN
jgi:dephospho-CoA kinase